MNRKSVREHMESVFVVNLFLYHAQEELLMAWAKKFLTDRVVMAKALSFPLERR